MSFKKSRAFSVLFMFALCALFAGVLSAIKVVTADKVRDNQILAASKNLVLVFELVPIESDTTGAQLAAAIRRSIRTFWFTEENGAVLLTDEKPEAGRKVVYRAWAAMDDRGRPVAYAFPIGGKGFWGPIEGIVSVQPDGETIRTVVWTRHGETPGLGARIEEGPYREMFRGKLATNPARHRFEVVSVGTAGDDPHKIDQITGATQTTVVGMGQFLNDNFAQWHTYFPMLKKRLSPADQPAEAATDQGVAAPTSWIKESDGPK